MSRKTELVATATVAIDAAINADEETARLPADRRGPALASVRDAIVAAPVGPVASKKHKPVIEGDELDAEREARGLSMLIGEDNRINPAMRQRVRNRLVSDRLPRDDRSKYIARLVRDNPTLAPKKLYDLADKSILGDMAETTFANRVSAIKS
jgi:hypothetical protein